MDCKPAGGIFFQVWSNHILPLRGNGSQSVSGQAHVNVTYELTCLLEIPQLFEKLQKRQIFRETADVAAALDRPKLACFAGESYFFSVTQAK